MHRTRLFIVALISPLLIGPLAGRSLGQGLLAEAYLESAEAARDQGNMSKAARLFALALEESHEQRNAYLTARALLGAATIHTETSDFDQVEENLRAALALCEGLSTPPARELATALNCMAMVCFHQGRLEQAEACYAKLLNELGTDEENAVPRAIVTNDLALVKIALEEPQQAIELAQAAADAIWNTFGSDSADYAHCLDTLAQALLAADRVDDAAMVTDEALRICAADPGEDSAQYASTLLTLSKIQHAQGDHAAATHTAELSIGGQEKTRGILHPLTNRAKAELAAMRDVHADHASVRRPSPDELKMFNEMYADTGLSHDELAELFAHWLRFSGPERLEHYLAFHAQVAGRTARVATPAAEQAVAQAKTETELEDDESLFHELYGRHKLSPEVLRDRREHWNELTPGQQRAAAALFRQSIQSNSAAK